MKLILSIWKTATLSIGPLQITNIESLNFIRCPPYIHKFVIDQSTFEYNACRRERIDNVFKGEANPGQFYFKLYKALLRSIL